MIRAVLFDFDGTLVNTNNLIIESFKYTYKKHFNISVDEKDIVKYFGEPLITTFERFDKNNAETLFKTYIEFNEARHDYMVEAFEGANDTLKELKNLGVKVGVVTSKRRILVERGLNVTGITEPMDVIITVEDTKRHKPLGDPLIKACEILNIKPSETLYVGDTHFDILCGKNAGCLTCLVKYTMLSLDELMAYSPDYIIEALMDLPEILKCESEKNIV